MERVEEEKEEELYSSKKWNMAVTRWLQGRGWEAVPPISSIGGIGDIEITDVHNGVLHVDKLLAFGERIMVDPEETKSLPHYV